MLDSNTYKEPKNLDDAEELRIQLAGDVQMIQSLLGDKQRTDENGERLSSHEYWLWKKNTQIELNEKLGILRTVKLWIKDKKISEDEYPSGDAIKHVSALYRLLRTIEGEGVKMDASEKGKMEAARKFLET